MSEKIYRNKTIEPEGFPEALSMDDIEDGTVYGKVGKDYVDGKGRIFLSKIEGVGEVASADNLDEIPDGASYGKYLLSALDNGKALLSQAVGNLDNIANGTYGKVLVTDISAGHILLASAIGNLDNIANGTDYGKVALTAISAGKIVLTAGGGVTGILPVGNTDAKCTNALADQTSINTAADTAKVQGYTIIEGGYIKTGFVNADYINAGTLVVGRTEAKCTNPNADQTSANTAYDITHAGGATGWQITAGYIKSNNGTIELKGSDTPHIKALYDANNYVQMTGEGSTPRFDVIGGGYLRTRLTKDGLYFYSTTGVQKGRIYGSATSLRDLYFESSYSYFSGAVIVGGNVDITGRITIGSTVDYGTLDWNGTTFRIDKDLQPSANVTRRLGYTNIAWYAVHSANYLACELPTSNSGIGVFKKIKKPKIKSGKSKDCHAGKRHYFEIEEFPDEMKMTDKDSGEKDIELTRTLGVTVNALRELIETTDDMNNRLKVLENNK